MSTSESAQPIDCDRLRQALTYPATPQSASNIATTMRTSPVHPSNISEAIAMIRATAASRNVGMNGQGLGVGEVIGDSVRVSHSEGTEFNVGRGYPMIPSGPDSRKVWTLLSAGRARA